MNVLGDELEPEESWAREALDPLGTPPPIVLTETEPEAESFAAHPASQITLISSD